MREILQLLCLISVCKIALSAQDPLISFTNEISGVSRVVNGMLLAELLADKSVKKEKVMQELLGLNRSQTAEELTDVAKVGDELTDIATKIQNCSIWCDDGNTIGNGISIFDMIMQSEIKDASNLLAGSSFVELEQFRRTLDKFYRSADVAREVIDALNDIANLEENDLSDVEVKLKSISKSKNYLNNITTTIPTLKPVEIHKNFATILGLELLLNQLAQNQSMLDTFKAELSNLNTSTSTFTSLLTSEKVSEFENKLVFFLTRKLPASEKFASAAFEDVEDIEKLLSTDLKSKDIENILEISSLGDLAKNLEPLSDLVKTLKPIHESFKNVPRGIDTITIGRALLNISSELDRFKTLQEFETCIGGVKLDVSFPFNEWKEANDSLKDFAGKLSKFETTKASKDIHKGLKELYEFKKLFQGVKNLEAIKNFEKISELKNEMKQFKTDIEAFSGTDSLQKFSVLPDLATALSKTKDWMNQSAIVPAVTCLLRNKLFDNVMRYNSIPIPPIPDLTTLSTAAVSLRTAVNLMKPSSPSKRSVVKRAASASMDLEMTQKFATGVDVFRKMSKAFENRAFIEKLTLNEQAIDAQIAANPFVSSKKDQVWSDKQKSALKNFPQALTQLSQSMPPKAKSLTDVEHVFKKAASIVFPQVSTVHLKSLFYNLQNVTDLQTDLDSLATLDLNFADAQTHLTQSMSGSSAILTYFEAAEAENESNEKTKNIHIMTTGEQLGIIFGGLLISAIIVGVLMTVTYFIATWWVERKDKKKAMKKDTKTKPNENKKKKKQVAETEMEKEKDQSATATTTTTGGSEMTEVKP